MRRSFTNGAAALVSVALIALALLAGCGDGGTTTQTAPGASCDPQAFLPILRHAINNPAQELRIVEARVRRCRNGYAQVFAVPDRSVCQPGVRHCYDTEQVFFHLVGGKWQILTSGTGLSCEKGALAGEGAKLREACRALGYR
jgi:hypothetical protein